MTRATTAIPFHDLTFIDDIAKLRDVEARWKNYLERIRQNAQDAELEAGKITDEDAVSSYYLVNDADMRRIKRRAMRTSARDGLPCVRFNPLVLNGPPSIGKSYRARRLAHHARGAHDDDRRHGLEPAKPNAR